LRGNEYLSPEDNEMNEKLINLIFETVLPHYERDFILKNTLASELRIVLFSPNRAAYSETFIKAHIERLPFLILPRFGHHLGIETENGRKVWIWGYWFDAFASRAMPKVHRAIRTFFLARHLRSVKADAVFAEYGITGSYLAPACEKVKIPLFVHFHGFDASVYDLLVQEGDSYRKMFRIAAGVVAVSAHMRSTLLQLGANAKSLYLSPCGVDSDRFAGAAPEKSRPEFLAVGRLVEKKAPYLTILALSRVIKTVPKATLTIIGNGPLFGPCQRLVQALHLDDSVTMLGVCNSDEISLRMRKARAFVQHSLVANSGDSEGMPVAIIEAQMSGLPVVATRHAGIPDVVINGETGFIIEEADVDGMADAMIKLAKDPMLAARLGTAARERAVTHFTINHHIEQLAEMIREGMKAKELV
jgi:glycosyltransferase involved in cell wall biosynthesis